MAVFEHEATWLLLASHNGGTRDAGVRAAAGVHEDERASPGLKLHHLPPGRPRLLLFLLTLSVSRKN